MTADPRAELTRQWLQVASEDLSLAELANVADPPLLSGVVYHCQQAFEKTLKAYLAWHNQQFRRTHDLVELVSTCEQIDSTFAALAQAADRISPYGTAFRYPPFVAGPTDLDAIEALDAARHHDVRPGASSISRPPVARLPPADAVSLPCTTTRSPLSLARERGLWG
jgi:HEPN domain-containing protein